MWSLNGVKWALLAGTISQMDEKRKWGGVHAVGQVVQVSKPGCGERVSSQWNSQCGVWSSAGDGGHPCGVGAVEGGGNCSPGQGVRAQVVERMHVYGEVGSAGKRELVFTYRGS